MKRYFRLLLCIATPIFLAFFAISALSLMAATTTGYAWGEKTGWINFGSRVGTSTVNVQVSTTSVAGYAWSQNFGWINLGPLASSSGVVNDGHGNLSGYGWGQNLGFVNFQGVTIDANGQFHGVASGSVAGRIQFESSSGCTFCNVTTSWSPSAVVPLSISSVFINGNNPATISLSPATTTNINVEATVNDNTCAQITGGTTTILLYRSGVGSSTCFTTPSNLNCYTTTAFTASSTCAGGVVNTTTTFAVQYFAQATDGSSSFPNQNWMATVKFTDSGSVTTSSNSTNVTSSNVMATTAALDVATSTITYGPRPASSTTGGVNQTTIVTNAGNCSTTLSLSGTALVNGSNNIATSSQHYATSSFTFGGSEQSLSGSGVSVSGFLLTAPTSTSNVQSTIFWGLIVPNGSATGTYTGSNLFAASYSP